MAGHSWYTTLSAQALRSVSDEALLSALKAHVSDERESIADIVEHLLELDRRGIVIERGYPSLFAYCRQALGYSEQASYLRIRAARTALEFPEIIEQLRGGKLHLEAIARLCPHLTQKNAPDLLNRAAGATKREVLAIVAPYQAEAPAEKDVVTPFIATEPVLKDEAVLSPTSIVPSMRQRFHFTADNELLELVERLRSLLRHKYPHGRFESIFKEAARALLDRIDPEHHKVPRPTLPSKRRSRLVPRAVRADVWKRDKGRCAYVSPEGRRCESREALEYDHIVPWAEGGRSDTPDNIRLLCRAHNQWLGRKQFGNWRRGANKNPAE